jgi:serine/threonine-protein kinase
MTAPTVPFPVPEGLRCGACNKAPTTAQIAESDYRCPGCGADLGHLDLAPNGMVRGVLGWLRQPGDVLVGRYRVRGFLGKGGFAATYLVEDQRLSGKRRAVKEIPEIFFDERETEILARIQHPAVPDITDRFAADGMVYLVLEFGGERTLEGVRDAEGGRVPLVRLRPWIDQLCDVLGYLHAQTPPIVHRDLKPANVLLDERDRVMLIDFGIAKEAAPDAATRTIARSASHGFSPPEQVMGTGTDQRSDVYALGATIYVLLTGEIPPAAHERVAGSDLVAPRQLVPELPQAIEDAILRALELNVARRHPTIDAFRSALASAPAASPARKGASAAPRTVMIGDTPPVATAAPAAGPATVAPVAAVPAPRRQTGIPPAALIAAGVLLLALVAAAAFWATRGEDEAAEPPVAATPAPSQAPLAPPATLPGDVAPAPEAAAASAASPPAAAAQPTPTAVASPAAAPAPVAPAPSSQGSALDALLSNRAAQPAPETARATERTITEGTKAAAPAKPPPARKPAAKPKPAQSGWEDFQGPTRGYERKIQ